MSSKKEAESGKGKIAIGGKVDMMNTAALTGLKCAIWLELETIILAKFAVKQN